MLGCSQDLTQNHATEWEQASSTTYYKKRLPWLQASPGNMATVPPEISMCLLHSHHGPSEFILCCSCFFNILLSVYFNSEMTEGVSDVRNRGMCLILNAKGDQNVITGHFQFQVKEKLCLSPKVPNT